MKLQIGERLTGSGPPGQPGGYVVSGVLAETPWYGWYRAKKLAYHFDFTARRPRETDDNEWLEVHLRTIHYPDLDDPDYVAARRSLVREEVQHYLGPRASTAWPAPLDLLEVANTRDPFTFPAPAGLAALEPIVVVERLEGAPLTRWRQGQPPVSALLQALAELLHLIRAAHADGLLLHGLGPAAVLIDPLGGLHFVGSDMVVAQAQAAALSLDGLVPGHVEWSRLFPPERFPRGFAAPECFDAAAPRDRRSDLYAWAALAYFLLTGDSPLQLALAQGQPWARFEEEQLGQLEKALRAIPPTQVAVLGESLGVSGTALVQGWPRNLTTVLQLCLRPEPSQRPASAADLCAWLLAPPPSPVPVALALRLEGPLAARVRPPRAGDLNLREGSQPATRLFLVVEDVKPGLEVVVRRGFGFQPTTIEEGDLVAEGPVCSSIGDDPPMPAQGGVGALVSYGIFLRQRHAAGFSASVVTVPTPLTARAEEVLRLAEGGAEAGTADEPEPRRVHLLFQAFQPVAIAEALLKSALPQVRAWAVRRLAREVRQPGGRALLLQALRDAVPALRMEAARALFEGSARPPLPLVRQVLEAVGGGDSDARMQAARSLLPRVGVADEVVRAAIAALQGDLPVVCPECKASVPARERPAHLVAAHGYVEVAGIVLPHAIGLSRLWDRVFSAADRDAHERLVEILAGPDNKAPAYAGALERELQSRAEQLSASRGQDLPRLVHCLRASPAACAQHRALLQADDARVREIARELALPDFRDQLASEALTVEDVRRWLDALCPRDGVDEKLRLCRRLPQFGLAPRLAEDCVQQLQLELPVACPECAAGVPRVELATHLRQVHRIYQFRGKRQTLNEALAALLGAVTGASPDYEAWHTLEEIAHEQFSAGAESFLAASVAQALNRIAEERRGQAINAVAEAAVAGTASARLLLLLAADGEVTARLLALRLAARLTAPLEDDVFGAVRGLLADKRLPGEELAAATAVLLRRTGLAGKEAEEVLNALIAGFSKIRAVERLRLLEQQVGNSPAIEELCARLEDQVRMRCPRCPLQFRRPDMIRHLWTEHGLLLDGRRVREPWRLIEDWINDYKAEGGPEVLARCRGLAQRLDPRQGLQQLYRLLLANGIEDAEAQRSLLADAEQQHGSLCPHCYALVPVSREVPLPALNIWKGRLSAQGYQVEVSDDGLLSRLEIQTPRGPHLASLEPGQTLTPKGAVILLAGPPVLAALLLALLLPFLGLGPLIPVALVLLAAFGAYACARIAWPTRTAPMVRAFRYAWDYLVPRLHAQGFAADDSAFVASLALASLERGQDRVARDTLDVLQEVTENAVAGGAGVVAHLAALKRLAITRIAEGGQDPVPLVAGQVARCFDGAFPLSYAQALLADWETPWWTRGNLGRLRIQVCDRAFEAGFEVRNLQEASQSAPALDAVIQIDNVPALAQLRLLWSLRPRQPWERCGPALTAFEFARDPEAAQLLARYPDLLLLQNFPGLALLDAPEGEPEGVQILVCSRGVAFGGVLFTEPARTIEVLARKRSKHGAYELVVDEESFRLRGDPDTLASRLERWFRFYFNDFLPQSAEVPLWQSPSVAATLRAQQAVACPSCHHRVVPREGEIGMRLDDMGEQPATTVVPV